MATVDKSVYLDNGNGNYANLFNSGKIAMLLTGPWDLSGFPDVDYGVQVLPGDQNHQTISGPDQWVLFDNGSERARRRLGVPQVVHGVRAGAWSSSLATGDLPIRASETELPGYQQVRRASTRRRHVRGEPGQRRARRDRCSPPTPRSRTAMGQAVQSVLLGKAEPKQALDQAAQQVDQILWRGS